MYQALTEEGFGGLDLRAPNEATGAIDLLNVDIDHSGGRLRQRGGFNNFTTSAAAGRYSSVYTLRGSSPEYIMARRGTTLEVIDPAGASAATATTAEHTRAVHFGAPASTVVYIADGTNPTRKLVGTTFTAGTALATVDGVGSRAMPEGYAIGVTPWDNRLVVAGGEPGPHTSTSSVHHIWFSDAGEPEAWDSGNYVQLTPGDGERIVEIVSWGNQLFVFKQTRIFIFYGTSTDSSGNPIFNYRTIELPAGRLSSVSDGIHAVAGPDGVYFITDYGLYVTTGGTPVEAAPELRPIFYDAIPSTFAGGSFHSASAATSPISWSLFRVGPRLFMAASRVGDSQTANDRVFVRTEDGQWVLWDVPIAGAAAVTGGDGFYFSYATGSNHIGFFNSSGTVYSDDDGTAITSRYRLPLNDYGVFEEKRIREIILEGTGTVNVKVATDWGSLDSGANVTLGSTPAIAETRHRVAYQARQFSVQFGSVSGGAWSLQRATVDLADTKVPGSKAT